MRCIALPRASASMVRPCLRCRLWQSLHGQGASEVRHGSPQIGPLAGVVAVSVSRQWRLVGPYCTGGRWLNQGLDFDLT